MLKGMKYPIEVVHIGHIHTNVSTLATRECWASQDKGGCYTAPTDDIVETDVKLLKRVVGKHRHRSVSRHNLFIFEVSAEDIYNNDLVHPLISSEWTKVTEADNGKTFIISANFQTILEMKIDDELKYILLPEHLHWLLDVHTKKEEI